MNIPTPRICLGGLAVVHLSLAFALTANAQEFQPLRCFRNQLRFQQPRTHLRSRWKKKF